MSEPPALPAIGACLPLAALREHLDWLVEGERDLELQDFTEASVLEGDWRDRVATARELLRDHRGRLGIHGPFWGFSIDSKDPDVRVLVARRMDRALDVADALGADQIVIHSPYRTWDANNLDMRPEAREALIASARDSLGVAIRRAEALGATFVLENIEDKHPADRRVLMEALDSRAVRLSVDTGHAHYAHVSTGAPPVDYFVAAAGEALEHVHLQDADGYADRHWAPGHGTVNWRAVFAALRPILAAGGRPRLLLELRDKRRVREGAGHLEALGLAR